MTVSAVFVVRNEEHRLCDALKRVRPYVDEIVVVDQSSDDATPNIAHELADKFLTDKNWGFCEPSRQMACDASSGDWILVLDADEEISEWLGSNLTVLADGEFDAYLFRRLITVDGVPLEHPGENIRFFRRGACYNPAWIHSAPLAKDGTRVSDVIEGAIVSHKSSAEQSADDERYFTHCTLRELFNKYGTNKETPQGFSGIYESLFADRRLDVRSVLEIGVGTMNPSVNSNMATAAMPHYLPGGSLRAWRNYFPKARVVGVDIDDCFGAYETGIEIVLMDSTNPEIRERLQGLAPFDLIVDDGSHVIEDQLATFRNCFPLLADGGYYFIEDAHGLSFLERLDSENAGSRVGDSMDPLIFRAPSE